VSTPPRSVFANRLSRTLVALWTTGLAGACGGSFSAIDNPSDAGRPDEESGTRSSDGGARDTAANADADAAARDAAVLDARDVVVAVDTHDVVTVDGRDAATIDVLDAGTADVHDAASPDVHDAVMPDVRDVTTVDARDAAPQDAPVSDAGLRDATVLDVRPPGDSLCYGPFAARRICEGFELPTIPPIWTANTRDGTVSRVASPTFRGLGSLEGSALASGGEGFVSRPGLGAVASGSVYLTARVRVPVGVPLAGVTALGLFGASGGVSVLLMDIGLAVVVRAQTSLPEVVVTGGANPYVLQRDVWHCVQLAIGISDSDGSVRLTVDDQLAVEGRTLNTAPSGGFDAALAGVIYSDAQQQPIRVWIDELVADNSPIPCP
jgi:hypothetical protein